MNFKNRGIRAVFVTVAVAAALGSVSAAGSAAEAKGPSHNAILAIL